MKKFLKVFITSIAALSLLVSCEESKKVDNKTMTEEKEATEEKRDINDLVTIKEIVNKEGISPNGEKVRYVYEAPIIHIDKPGAKRVNETFLNLIKDLEERMDDGQLIPLSVSSKAYLNDGIISVVMDTNKTGPEGIYAVNYEIDNDQEISTKDLLENYQFDPQRLIAEINRQVEINGSKPETEQDFFGIDYFADTIITNSSDFPSQDEYLKKLDEIQKKTMEEKERFVVENIDKIKAYLNQDGKFVFIHRAALSDEELIVE
ncbi:hypothetical protein R4Z09_20755 [Niallia oryzisoli]|uniref:Lipoprotein n=1 Tax=Niallia oryzisoli TaxID=1737571 RepID=A0ABZ2CCN6_9BACI